MDGLRDSDRGGISNKAYLSESSVALEPRALMRNSLTNVESMLELGTRPGRHSEKMRRAAPAGPSESAIRWLLRPPARGRDSRKYVAVERSLPRSRARLQGCVF